MAMRERRLIVLGLAVCAMASVIFVPTSASATDIVLSGTSPSFSTDTSWSMWVGYLGAGDILAWEWSSSDSLSFAIFTSPDMTWYYDYSSYDGFVVETPGHYNLWWHNDNWFFSATVTYEITAFTPSLTIDSPTSSDYVNSRSIELRGAFDGYATSVLVGPDMFHFREATIEGDNWQIDDVPLEEGQNTILVRSFYWLDYGVNDKYSIDRTIDVTCDTTSPSVSIVGPSDGGLVRDNYVDIGWQCSDDCGIAKSEMKIDGWGWSSVTGTSYNDLRLSTGEHTIQIRVTDMAGNLATDSTTFTVDARALSFDGPYYGLPLVGIVLGLVIVAITLVVLLRRRRGGAAIATAPEETTPESALESVPADE